MQLALGLIPPWMVKACAFDADIPFTDPTLP
jgi:hypothetical protein